MKRPVCILAIGLLVMVAVGGCADRSEGKNYWTDPAAPVGLRVVVSESETEDGVFSELVLAHRPFRATGVNCYDLFVGGVMRDSAGFRFDLSNAYATLDILKSEGVPVVRFNCGVYYDHELPACLEHDEEYFDALQKVAEYAQQQQIGLIPSVFWHYAAIPRYYGEPYRGWGCDTSRTMEFMRFYTRRVVESLHGYKSIFAWEFGNEFNLEADLPNWRENYKTEDPNNRMTADDVRHVYDVFVRTVREIDTTGRLICSGNAALRPSQYHQYVENTWVTDTPQEYETITGILNPEGMQSVSEHLYDQGRKIGPSDSLLSLDGQLALAMSAARSLGKVYYVGEFAGVLPAEADYRVYYDAFLRAGVPLSLVWNFSNKGNIEYSFTAESERGKYIFALIREYNEKLQSQQE